MSLYAVQPAWTTPSRCWKNNPKRQHGVSWQMPLSVLVTPQEARRHPNSLPDADCIGRTPRTAWLAGPLACFSRGLRHCGSNAAGGPGVHIAGPLRQAQAHYHTRPDQIFHRLLTSVEIISQFTPGNWLSENSSPGNLRKIAAAF